MTKKLTKVLDKYEVENKNRFFEIICSQIIEELYWRDELKNMVQEEKNEYNIKSLITEV